MLWFACLAAKMSVKVGEELDVVPGKFYVCGRFVVVCEIAKAKYLQMSVTQKRRWRSK